MQSHRFVGQWAVALCGLAIVTSAFAQQYDVGKVTEAEKQCRLDSQDKRLDILRGKMRIYTEDVTAAMLSLDRKPTAQEAQALEILFDNRVRCTMRYMEIFATGTAPQALLSLRARLMSKILHWRF